MKENRKFIRLQAPIEVIYKLIKKNKRQKSSNSLVKNISGGGIKIMANEELRNGDLLDLQIQVPHLEESIHAVGEVAWFKHSRVKDRERDREIKEAGVRFRDIDPKDLHRILEYVHTIGIG